MSQDELYRRTGYIRRIGRDRIFQKDNIATYREDHSSTRYQLTKVYFYFCKFLAPLDVYKLHRVIYT